MITRVSGDWRRRRRRPWWWRRQPTECCQVRCSATGCLQLPCIGSRAYLAGLWRGLQRRAVLGQRLRAQRSWRRRRLRGVELCHSIQPPERCAVRPTCARARRVAAVDLRAGAVAAGVAAGVAEGRLRRWEFRHDQALRPFTRCAKELRLACLVVPHHPPVHGERQLSRACARPPKCQHAGGARRANRALAMIPGAAWTTRSRPLPGAGGWAESRRSTANTWSCSFCSVSIQPTSTSEYACPGSSCRLVVVASIVLPSGKPVIITWQCGLPGGKGE